MFRSIVNDMMKCREEHNSTMSRGRHHLKEIISNMHSHNRSQCRVDSNRPRCIKMAGRNEFGRCRDVDSSILKLMVNFIRNSVREHLKEDISHNFEQMLLKIIKIIMWGDTTKLHRKRDLDSSISSMYLRSIMMDTKVHRTESINSISSSHP